jgi:hypothetical protein
MGKKKNQKASLQIALQRWVWRYFSNPFSPKFPLPNDPIAWQTNKFCQEMRRNKKKKRSVFITAYGVKLGISVTVTNSLDVTNQQAMS